MKDINIVGKIKWGRVVKFGKYKYIIAKLTEVKDNVLIGEHEE